MHGDIDKTIQRGKSRENLYYDFRIGEPHTQEDVDYLIKTSELLNSCIDQKLMNNLFKLVNPDIVQ